MGNCMETCMQWKVAELQIQQHEKQGEDDDEEEAVAENGFVKESDEMEKTKSSRRIKVVLTKEELEWLILELKGQNNGSVGKRSLEDVLAEIERSRGFIEQRWKPSLESIMEGPELPEMARS